ncbi:DUF4254 domain-containing protein [Nocardia sp. SYP-A9097]|uniref:DUF4254 domain-containing protein n=1 Tax=Nocardia sp. SYP-A9097 TaxID=2663237 RepID=UPI00129A280A|nr:DUF4254 domain-containing protein [Nocardia sp. SYP-A9097]MRH88067.1 DUF4254 domain-containing protein [Nocardia sp. SYP-A9097]
MFRHEHVATDSRLPDWHELLATFGGHRGEQPGDHPLLRSARTLAELHHDRLDQPARAAEIDCRRSELIATIDGWMNTQPRRSYCAHRIPPIALGGVVDRMAACHAHADHLLHSSTDISEERVHIAWHRLAALADDWSDLVAGVPPSERLHTSRDPGRCRCTR